MEHLEDMRVLWVRTMVAVAVAATLTVGVAVVQPSEAPASPPVDRLAWGPCYRDVGAELGVAYECAQLQVPLDHDEPNGPQVQLAVVRLPATDPAGKIGSILLNPGGPGGSGVDFALFFGPFAEQVWGPEVRARFDIVGFDPRGVGRSKTLRCFGNERQAAQVFPPLAFPLTPEEEAVQASGDGLLADQCDQRGARIGEHMSTANVARDMDLLRQAVGDEQLTYVGGSYGSFLGVTYANLFPDRVRAVTIDGILDPVAWVNVEGEIPFSTRLRSDRGALATLERLFEMCEAAEADNCALAPNSADRFDALAERFLAGPVSFVDPGTGETVVVTYQDLIGQMLGALRDPFVYAEAAQLVAFLEAVAFGADPGVPPAQAEQAAAFVNKRGFPHYRNDAEAFPAVACSDSNNPTDHAAWAAAGADADATFGYFGRPWTWASSPCAVWPLADEDRHVGPFDAETANPLLVIGNLQDPATPFEGAQTVRGLLPNSALLTVDMPGHTSLGISGCAGFLTGQYLLDPSVAPSIDGTTCPPEFNPFDLAAGGPPAAGALGLSPAMRARLMAETAWGGSG